MVPSFDSGPGLLCGEDNNSIMGWEDEVLEDDDDGCRQKICGFPLDLPLESEDCVALLVSKEGEFMPKDDYIGRIQRGDVDISVRGDAINWMWKVHAHYGFQALSAYLCVNYLDRFLSSYELPRGKTWMMQLLSVTCLSLAAKMEETDVPLALDLQIGDAKFVFEARTIRRMELLVLSTLNWRMCAATPFSFIDFFFRRIRINDDNNGDDNPPSKGQLARSTEFILSTIKGINFLEFKPSEVAAAVAICVAEQTHAIDVNKAAANCTHTDKVRVLRCYEVIQDILLLRSLNNRSVGGALQAAGNNKNSSSTSGLASSAHSPNGVLEAAGCFSYKSNEDQMNQPGSCASSHISPVGTKRRRLNNNNNNNNNNRSSSSEGEFK